MKKMKSKEIVMGRSAEKRISFGICSEEGKSILKGEKSAISSTATCWTKWAKGAFPNE
jgi:hypothetical protein